MKRIIIAAMIAAVALASVACGGKKGADWTPKGKSFSNSSDSVSYALGLYVGQNIYQSKEYYENTLADEFNETKFMSGLRAAMKGQPGWAQEDIMNFLQHYFQDILPVKQAENAEKQRAEGEKYLTKIKEEAGVQKTESGLLYKIEAAGNDVKATANDQVQIKYKGTKTNGEVFDSSYERGDTVTLTFPLNNVIRGFAEGLQLIGEGGKIKLWIPEDIGYGQSGPDPNMPLIFEVELIKVIPAPVVEEEPVVSVDKPVARVIRK